jgi:surface protein
MNNLDFVRPIVDDNINYREDQQELIEKALEISNGNPLNALQYIVACMKHEEYDIEFELVFQIPANTEVTITLPIIETKPKDELGYYVSWNDEITHNTNVHTYRSIDKIKEYRVRFFGLGISGFGRSLNDGYKKYQKYHDRLFGLDISEFERLLNDGYKKYLTKVISFGILGYTFTSLKYAFNQCENNFTVPQTLPSSITDTNSMFYGCKAFNQPLNGWTVNNVTDMSFMFQYCINFNQPLDAWSVNNVLIMRGMFDKCTNFNQLLNTWSVNNVIDTHGMFSYCTNFNQPLNSWSVNNVKNMHYMFSDCTNFNQPLDTWSVNNVSTMYGMFRYCTNFNQPLNTWTVNNVIDMSEMFKNCNILEENKPIFQQ